MSKRAIVSILAATFVFGIFAASEADARGGGRAGGARAAGFHGGGARAAGVRGGAMVNRGVAYRGGAAYRPGYGVGAAAAGAAIGAAAAAPYYGTARCGYYPYPPCY